MVGETMAHYKQKKINPRQVQIKCQVAAIGEPKINLYPPAQIVRKLLIEAGVPPPPAKNSVGNASIGNKNKPPTGTRDRHPQDLAPAGAFEKIRAHHPSTIPIQPI